MSTPRSNRLCRWNHSSLLSIDGQPIVLGSSVPMKGLTADENIKIVTALIVSDEVYYKYVAPDTVTVYDAAFG